ncbi:MAG: hypothetical protein KGI29_08950 [Pseudomonadota bacterium]|nr:hypothetical protein [Pseudomonadota bacterium]
MSVNPLLAAFAAPLNKVLNQIITAGNSIVSEPTTENVIEQGEELALQAINPSQLEGLSIGAVAQELVNVATTLQAHLQAATVAPSATSVGN